jgi:tyrosyl-tRNA synthetase
MNLIDDLKYRGLINQVIDEEGLNTRLNDGPITFYCGFDPSANSLQLGNLLVIMTAKRLAKYGHKPILLVGGMTGLIGDPSGRSDERVLPDEGMVFMRVDRFKNEMSRFFDFKNEATLVNNYDWFCDFKLIEFLREVGKHFTVSYLLNKEFIKSRLDLEEGISYAEFSYGLIQAYDFYQLYLNHGCEMQLAGNDQWGNITSGTSFIEQKLGKKAFGLTLPILVDDNGKKLSKSFGNTVYLDKEITTPFQFYQYFLNLSDEISYQWIKMFTFLTEKEIEEKISEQKEKPETRLCQKYLARFLTGFVHDLDSVERVEKISEVLFNGDISSLDESEFEEAFKDVKSFEVDKKQIEDIELVDLLVLSEISGSKRQAREDIENKAININGIIYCDILEKVTIDKILFDKYIVIRRGKKTYFLIKIK